MAGEQAAIKVKAGTRYDFWFSDEGLYRVEILRRAALELSSGLSILVMFAAGGLIPESEDPSGLVRAAFIFGASAPCRLEAEQERNFVYRSEDGREGEEDFLGRSEEHQPDETNRFAIRIGKGESHHGVPGEDWSGRCGTFEKPP
jgi:hypothetical protein